MIAALPETDADESLPEVVAEEPVIERKTSRPKSAASAEVSNNDAPSDRATPRPKSKRSSKKPTQPVAAEEPVVADVELSAEQTQEIEDQILEELMAPSPKKGTAETGLPVSMPTMVTPAIRSAAESIPQDSWASTPHVASPSSASSFSRSTPTPSTRPPAKSFKPISTRPPMSDRFKDPKVLKGIAILAPLLLIAAWLKMPESSAADIESYQSLDLLLTELRETRKTDPDGRKVMPIGKKLEATAKEIAAKLKKTADADHPARQSLLWATQSIPGIVKNGLGSETPSEKEALSHLKSAAVALGLQEAPPATMVADNNSNEP